MENFHSNWTSLSVFLFNYLQAFDFLFELQILFTQHSMCFGLSRNLASSLSPHFALQQTQQVLTFFKTKERKKISSLMRR